MVSTLVDTNAASVDKRVAEPSSLNIPTWIVRRMVEE